MSTFQHDDDPGPRVTRPLTLRQLDLMDVVVKRRIGAAVGDTVSQTAKLSLAADDMVAELRVSVLAEKLPPEKVEHTETVTFEHPDGWWQTFRDQYRDRWWMRWSTRRWPVRHQTHRKSVRLAVSLQRFHAFPEATVVLPELGNPVRVALTEQAVSRW